MTLSNSERYHRYRQDKWFFTTQDINKDFLYNLLLSEKENKVGMDKIEMDKRMTLCDYHDILTNIIYSKGRIFEESFLKKHEIENMTKALIKERIENVNEKYMSKEEIEIKGIYEKEMNRDDREMDDAFHCIIS